MLVHSKIRLPSLPGTPPPQKRGSLLIYCPFGDSLSILFHPMPHHAAPWHWPKPFRAQKSTAGLPPSRALPGGRQSGAFSVLFFQGSVDVLSVSGYNTECIRNALMRTARAFLSFQRAGERCNSGRKRAGGSPQSGVPNGKDAFPSKAGPGAPVTAHTRGSGSALSGRLQYWVVPR